MKRKKYKRSIKVVYFRQQGRFALTLVLYAITVHLFFLCASLTEALAVGADLKRILALPLAMRQLLASGPYHSVAAVLTLVFAFFTALLFSHQIFGPIKRFELAIQNKRERPQEHINCNLRRADYFQAFSAILEGALNQTRPVEDSRAESFSARIKST